MTETTAPRASRNYWDSRANRFARFGDGLPAVCSYGMPGFYNWSIHLLQQRALRRWVPCTRNEKVLEIGCGVGRWSRRLSRRGVDVVGLDHSLVMVSEARRRAERAGVGGRCHFLVADCSNFSLNMRFERILGITVLQHVLDPLRFQAAIERLVAHLARDGVIVLLEAAPCRSEARCNGEIFVARNEQTYLEAFEAAGLRPLAIEGVDSRPVKTRFLPYYRQLPRPLAVAGLFAATLTALPIDLLASRWCRWLAWHKLFVLVHR